MIIRDYYTDGSTRNNGAPDAKGAWGFIIVDGNSVVNEKCQVVENTTNQYCELKAMIEACKDAEAFKEKKGGNVKFNFYSDSAYVINCYNNKWYETWERNNWRTTKGTGVLYKDLWEELIVYFRQTDTYSFMKVPGHAGNKYNNMVDELVRKATE